MTTRDKKEYLIPNENLMTTQVENWSYSSREVRIKVPVIVRPRTDIALAERLMSEAAQPVRGCSPRRACGLADRFQRRHAQVRDPDLDRRSRGRPRQRPFRRAQAAVGAVQGKRHRHPAAAADVNVKGLPAEWLAKFAGTIAHDVEEGDADARKADKDKPRPD